mgnify:CR=1 FL=1
MKLARTALSLVLAAQLAACGGGGSSSSAPPRRADAPEIHCLSSVEQFDSEGFFHVFDYAKSLFIEPR